MNGTTLCSHCSTRFKISEAQLTAHRGMVRCGHCLQAFDARPSFIPDQPSPQLSLPIDEPDLDAAPATYESHIRETPEAPAEQAGKIATDYISPLTLDSLPDTSQHTTQGSISPDTHDTRIAEVISAIEQAKLGDALQTEENHYVEHLTLAERVVVDQGGLEPEIKPRRWPWVTGLIMATLLLAGQSAYFLRVYLAAHLPAMKPALIAYCHLLGCTVPLPHNSELISIESSSLDAEPAHENQITLNALLRNHAGFSQAFPRLSLTLNDKEDKPLARRIFTPAEYLPPDENIKSGFPGNHEVNIKLPLHTGELRPVGYQLEFFYGHDDATPVKPATHS